MSLGFFEALVTQQVDGPALVAAASASMLAPAARKTIGPNYFNAIGQQLLIKASGRISSLITTPGTARFDVRLGGAVVWDSLAILLDTVQAHVNVGWELEILLTLRAIGAAANFHGVGKWACQDILGRPVGAPVGSLTAMLPWNTAPAVGGNFDSTVSQQLDMNFTQTAATGSLTVHQYAAYCPVNG
jgi:hypothetical protein